MPDMTEPPASAPPPMVPSARCRALAGIGRLENKARPYPLGGVLRTSAVAAGERLATEAYRDGWNAALAAQPPEPPVEGVIVSADEYERVLATINDPPPPTPAIIRAAERLHAQPTPSTPPQPGDAERRIRLLRIQGFVDSFADKHAARNAVSALDAQFLLDELDAAQSALAESRAEVERLQERLHEVGTNSYGWGMRDGMSYADDPRLRSPTATEEEYIDIVFDGPPGPESGRFVEVESPAGTGIRFGEWIHRPDGYWVIRFQSLAASRSQGVREGIEMAGEIGREAIEFAHGWIAGLPVTPSFEDKRAAQVALELARDKLVTLSAPEPQP